jgi:hypothetical protein
MTIKIIAAILAISSLTASARIGETPTECRSRYGTPQKVFSSRSMILFKKSGFYIEVTLWKGKCHKLMFYKAAGDNPRAAKGMSKVEIKALLNANKGRSSWRELGVAGADRNWTLDDGTAHAAYSTSKTLLVIMTKDYLRHLSAEGAKMEKAKTRGF